MPALDSAGIAGVIAPDVRRFLLGDANAVAGEGEGGAVLRDAANRPWLRAAFSATRPGRSARRSTYAPVVADLAALCGELDAVLRQANA